MMLAMSRCLALVVLLGSACALPLQIGINQLKANYPDIVPSVQSSGLADAVPSEELGRCGPNRVLADLIPDCPLPGICFTAACFNHDLCYTTCGSSRANCDEVFFWDMVYLCDTHVADFVERDRCYSLAWIYYRAVDRYGEEYFFGSQDIVCARPGQARALAPEGQGPEPAARSVRLDMTFPFVDLDDDLMPDDWEICVGLDPADPGDAWLDYDGDGWVNLAEYTHAGDPYVP